MLKVLTGKDSFNRVIVMHEDGTKLSSYQWGTFAYKVQSNKKGDFITVNKKRHYIEIPKGEWKLPEGLTSGKPRWYPTEPIQHEETKKYLEDPEETKRIIESERKWKKEHGNLFE